MGLTSFNFLCFLVVTLFVYYIFPKKFRWTVLLFMSVVYYLMANDAVLFIYPCVAIAVAYAGAILIKKTSEQKRKKIILCCCILIELSMLAVLKYVNSGEWLVPLGVSFYTFTLMGYLFDVYYELGEVEYNPFKLVLFGMFFTNMISGPIMRYRNVKESLFGTHKFEYQRVCFGCQRILWGLFQKLVVSERLAVLVNGIYGNPEEYSGGYIVIAVLGYTLQLYTDFAGCMDIVMGVGQTLGICLPENFKHPFSALTIQEFWQKWHITLGTWLKDYLFYPLLRTDFFMNLPIRLREKLGKKRAKQITGFSAMLILWFTIGLWHGGAVHFIIGTGVLQWIYIVTGELIEPGVKKLCEKYRINRKCKWYQNMQKIKVFSLMSFAFMIFRAPDMKTVFIILQQLFNMEGWNSLLAGSVFTLGLDMYELIILVVSLGIFAVISHISAVGKRSIYTIIAEKPLLLRWTVWYIFIFYIILFGQYGPGYSASEFIYQGF